MDTVKEVKRASLPKTSHSSPARFRANASCSRQTPQVFETRLLKEAFAALKPTV